MSFFFLFRQAVVSGGAATGDPTLVIEVRARPTTVPDGGTGTKDPADLVVCQFDWTDNLAAGVTLAQSNFSVSLVRGVATTPLTATQENVLAGGLKTQVLLSAGANGSTWRVVNTVVTSSGETKQRSGFVRVEIQ